MIKKIHSYVVEDQVNVNIYLIFENDHFMGKIVEISMAAGCHTYQFFKKFNQHISFGSYKSYTTYPLNEYEMVNAFNEALGVEE